MSHANVELVLGLYPAPELDYVPLYRDDSLWTAWAKDLAPFVQADFECVNHEFGSGRRYAGLDGVRALCWTG
jgi:hypothetical protein